MQNRVTVIPCDRFISLDGHGLFFDFPAPENLHALQWQRNNGWLEFTDGAINQAIGEHEFTAQVQPFVDAWAAESERLRKDAERTPSMQEMQAYARAKLREKRKEVEYGGFEFDGQHWDSAEKDELRLNSISRLFESGITEYKGWKIAEGVYVTLTPAIVQRVAMALMQHYGHAFAVEERKLAEIAALSSVEGVTEWLENSLNVGW